MNKYPEYIALADVQYTHENPLKMRLFYEKPD